MLAVCFLVCPEPSAPQEDQPVRLPGRIIPERAEVDLVLIDVLVTDRKGRPLPGLEAEDFELRIDSHPSQISTFESYCDDPVSPAGSGTDLNDMSFSRSQPLPSAGSPRPLRHVVLFFDINQLTWEGRNRAIDASLEYVEERMRPHDRVMILAMRDEPRLMQDFTSDRELLATRLKVMREDAELVDRHYLEERLNLNDIVSRDCNAVTGCVARNTVAIPYAHEEMFRAIRSLEALRTLMPALGAIQGRKTLVHFSEQLRDEPGLQYLILAETTPSVEGIDIRLAIDELHREANAAGVSLYMVWAAGLGEKGSLGIADASRNLGAADTVRMERALLGSEDAALALGATLALETGGVATGRTNDLGLAFKAVERDLSCYYVLGYVNKGPGDGARHQIKVRVNRRKVRVRHRSYYDDSTEEVRLNRRFESALLTPQYFDDIPVKAEAYALAPEKKKMPILLKVEFPVARLTTVPQADGSLYGEAEVRTRVWTEGEEKCEFQRRIPVTVPPGEETAGRKVIYEAGCELPPGEHELTAAVLDVGTWTLGASGETLPVPEREAGVVGDVVLWTSSGGDLLSAEDAAAIGIHSTGAQIGFVPRAQRRLHSREPGLLYAVVCPPDEGGWDKGTGIEVWRRLFSGGTEVATYQKILLGDAGGRRRSTGACQGVAATLPAGHLGPGGYIFELEIRGVGAAPIRYQAGLAVEPPGHESMSGF